MGKKQTAFSFASGIRRHTINSFGADIGLNDFQDTVVKILLASGGKINKDHFNSAHSLLTKAELGFRALNFIGKVTTGLLDNDSRAATNNGKSLIPFISQNMQQSIGKNDCIYYTTHVHLGKPSSKKINQIKSGPFIERLTKTLADSREDYQEHKKRQNLQLKCGFNEKGFAFLGEDTYLSVNDYLKLYNVEKRFTKEINSNRKDLKDFYGCGLSTFHQIKLRNRMDCYSLHIKIHLIKILDLETDVRKLLQEITHHSEDPEYKPPYNSGKILLDDQYSTPNFKDKSKKFAIDFQTSLSCNLNNSSKFRERAKIVKTWTSTLAAGSYWDFNITYHLGNGIHINYLYDLENKEHPSGYIFCLEYIGDRRASIVRASDKDVFMGYSPCNILFEFKTEFTYLTNQNNEDELLVIKTNKKGKQFDEDSEFPDIFYPDRKETFHVNTKDINYNGDNQKASYILEYDQSITSTADIPNFLKSIKTEFENLGLDPETASENDVNLNLRKSPSRSTNTQYNGPDTPLNEDTENEDEDEDDGKGKGFLFNLRKS
jgi:hypothetical protein